MPAILPSVKIDSNSLLAEYFMPHQVAWILAEDSLHQQHKQVFALAEKSVQIGWTYADAFKNVRKRLRFPRRDYLFATKDYPSALEYMRLASDFAALSNFTRAIISHGEEWIKIERLDPDGKPTAFTDDVKVGYIKFDNKSRIIAFSAHPQAMAVYSGDVGLDEFAKHSNAELLWQTAQGRVTWGFDLAVWSSHQGDDTLFYQFVQQAKAGKPPWNLYFRVTMPDAIEMGLVEAINQTRDSQLNRDEFLASCKARAGLDEVFEQTYMCNPLPAGAAIADWSAIERCRDDYQIDRLHMEAFEIQKEFGPVDSSNQLSRQEKIEDFISSKFKNLLRSGIKSPRLGFDVAASGEGDLAVIYIDEPKGNDLWLRALFTCRTEDWHFIKTVLFFFLRNLRYVQAAGDESGLGRQICWEAAHHFAGQWLSVNFASKKHDLGFTLMNQLSTAEKRFPRSEQDIAADFFALRKFFTGTKWIFTEGRNNFNEASHCDIAWAAALASHANCQWEGGASAAVLNEDGSIWRSDVDYKNREHYMMWCDDPKIWRPFPKR